MYNYTISNLKRKGTKGFNMNILHIITPFYLTILFTIQISCMTYTTIAPNLLLLHLTFILFYHYSLYQYIFTLCMIDLLLFIKSGTVGLSIPIVPLSYILLKLEKKLYLKTILPYLFISLYLIYQESLLYFKLSHPIELSTLFCRLCINNIMFMIIIQIYKFMKK